MSSCLFVTFIVIQDILFCDGGYIKDKEGLLHRAKRTPTRMTLSEQALTVDKHNVLRRQEGASDMELMVSDQSLK